MKEIKEEQSKQSSLGGSLEMNKYGSTSNLTMRGDGVVNRPFIWRKEYCFTYWGYPIVYK